MSEKNIERIKKFLLDRFSIDETRIEYHLKHDLIIRLKMVTVDSNKKLIINFECLDCKEKWNHSINGKRSHLLRICSTIHYFFSHQIQMTHCTFGTYRLDKDKYKLTEINEDKEKSNLIEMSGDKDERVNSKEEFGKIEVLKSKFKKKRARKVNIPVLLKKYQEEDIKNIDDKEYNLLKPERMFDCEICTNYDSKREFCDTYDSFPFTHPIPPEEYCNEFTLDKSKEAKREEESTGFPKFKM
ncbi:MAG: hypothetical protein ACFFEN_15770 [Candidatus Thorarchaeota archaeon]